MRWLFRLFAGLVLIAVMLASLFCASAIFDANQKSDIEAYFFQPANSPRRRPGVPASPSAIGDADMLNMLIARYLSAFFTVTPDTNEVAQRIAAQTELARMSSKEVFDYWKTDIAPEIQKMSQDKMLRLVRVTDVSKETIDGNYWRVNYETKTWNTPNDLSVVPQVYNGIVYMNIIYVPGMRQYFGSDLKPEPIEPYLEKGGDPAAVFKFGVTDMIIPE